MKRTPKTIITQLAMALVAMGAAPALEVVVAGVGEVYAQAQGSELADLERSWEDSVGRREMLISALEPVEQEYDSLVSRIEEIKREGGSDGLRRQRLEEMLREGRVVAERLQEMQRAVTQADEEIAEISEAIVALIDAEVRSTEREMAAAKPRARAAFVKRLNALSTQRARYARPLPQISMREVSEMLESVDEVEDPDEMLALADELQDAEENVRQKLDWVRGRLGELRQRKKLMRRARNFKSQESFFEEGDRGRAVASRVRTNSSERDNVNSDGDQAAEPPARDSNEGNNASDFDDSANNAADPVYAGGDQAGGGAGGGVENGAPGDDGLDAAPAEPDPAPGAGEFDAPETDGATGGDYGGGDDYGGDDYGTVVVERQADPGAPARGAYFDDADLDARIDALEGDERSLVKQASQLKRRAARLRKKASRVE